ncbi:universal stress protein [Maribacter sp. CXY002]|uniref:universal stress protein n=1 Tax=Maribacter luteocoastalis TaxID=3407671 RepID=UPI003B66C103
MKTILYATDYSKESIAALKYAHTIAKLFASRLVVLHVFDIGFSLASPISMSYLNKEKKMQVKHRTKLEDYCAEHLGDSLKDLLPKIMVVESNVPVDGIQQTALKVEADLIVVGTKGASAIREFFLGSTTKGLFKKAPCTVMAVPPEFNPKKIKTIVYASDFEQADVFAIRKLVKIATSFDAKIRIIHIATDPENSGYEQMQWFREMLQEKTPYAKMEFDLIFSDNVLKELQSYVEDSKIDLLAMLERKNHTFFEKHIKPDLVKQLVSETKVPLMSFNEVGL